MRDLGVLWEALRSPIDQTPWLDRLDEVGSAQQAPVDEGHEEGIEPYANRAEWMREYLGHGNDADTPVEFAAIVQLFGERGIVRAVRKP